MCQRRRHQAISGCRRVWIVSRDCPAAGARPIFAKLHQRPELRNCMFLSTTVHSSSHGGLPLAGPEFSPFGPTARPSISRPKLHKRLAKPQKPPPMRLSSFAAHEIAPSASSSSRDRRLTTPSRTPTVFRADCHQRYKQLISFKY